MHKKTMSLIATVVAFGGFALAVFVPSASAHKSAATGTYCEYGEYNQYGECCTYAEYQQYGECTTTTTTTGVVSPTQTVTPAGVTVKSTAVSTLVNVSLPAGTAWRKFYLHTVYPGVSFGANHSYELLKKDILLYDGSTKLTYNISKLSRPHGRVYLVLKKAVTATTFKVNKNVFEFTAAERKLIKRLNIKKTTVSVEITTTTGKVYDVTFKTSFGALVVIKFH